MTSVKEKELESLWVILSELYLDTELKPSNLTRFTTLLKSKNVTIEKIKTIDREHLFPFLYGNLLSPAGVWTDFE